ncbi:MAG: DNA cytosine methyltransferase, partial [Clostridia bacterium]|nr:DNA cytosine methyltransferase [Clostridia bacterium]
MSGQIDLADELTVDGFCGGGGWSTGFELAIGRPVDIGINHDADAIAMHKKNHPFTKHYNENIFEVDPYEATQGRPVGWAHFSPDCTHFSRAKGGTPVKKSIRGLAWVVTKWAGTVHPRIISMENVPEFMTWGPLRAYRDSDGCIIKTDNTVAEKHEYVPYSEQHLVPDIRTRGQTFRRFISVMKSLGYEYEWRILTASDYGAPTIRKRLFIIFRNDGQPIVWPKPTHGDPNSEGFKYSNLLPWHTAAECIDWSIPCSSIFERKKPLADNTLKRIAKGIQKFVIENPKPLIVQVNHSGDNFRGQSVDKPLPTVTAKHGYGIVTPTLIQYHGEQSENEVRGQALERPLQTVDTRNRYGLVTAFMSKYFGGGYKGAGSGVDEPLHTVTAVDHNALA